MTTDSDRATAQMQVSTAALSSWPQAAKPPATPNSN